MSGISGVVNIRNGVDTNKLKAMTDIIRHRGPDDDGFYLSNENGGWFLTSNETSHLTAKDYKLMDTFNKKCTLGFGHRRLKNSLCCGSCSQPMFKHSRVIIFDGNIFNYIAIKIELEANGYIFNSDTDTEVILSAYDLWGEHCVTHFNGMWAFAIYDTEENSLFCSRDRIGIKPFYYYHNGDFLIFSSEIKQILEYGVKAELNKKALHMFLTSGVSDFSDETFFKDIKSLNPSTNLYVDLRDVNNLGISRKVYWKLDADDDKYKGLSYEDNCNCFGEVLEDAIRQRISGDLPLGCTLSGGLDSSAIVTLASPLIRKEKHKQDSFYTFSFSIPGSLSDETYFSDIIAKSSDCTPVHVVAEEATFKDDFKTLLFHQEEPFQSLSIYAGWLVMREAKRNGISILLDGQGADEILLGYERYYSYIIREYLKQKKFVKAVGLLRESSRKSKLKKWESMTYLIYFNFPKNIKKYKSITLKSKLSNRFLHEFPYPKEVLNFSEISSIADLHVKAVFMGLQRLLKWEDKNSMAHSVETRLPFLDHRVIECAVNSPIENKVYNGWLKSLLRGFMRDKMSSEVVYRKNKFGFQAPDDKLINSLDTAFIRNLLSNPRSKDFFNMDYIEQCFNKKKDTNMRFLFLVTELWMETFNVQF